MSDGSLERLLRRTTPTAPAALARVARVEKAQLPRSTRTSFPASGVPVDLVAQRRVRPQREPCVHELVRRGQRRRDGRHERRRGGERLQLGRHAARAEHVAADAEEAGGGGRRDGDHVGRGAGRADRAGTELLEGVAGRDGDDDAGADRVLDGDDQGVRTRVDLGAAERQVDDVHPVLRRLVDGRRDLGGSPGGPVQRIVDGQGAVVAEVGARRHAREPGHHGQRPAGSGRRAVVAGGDARDVGRVLGHLRVERQLRAGVGLAALRERAGHDDLRRRVARVAAREARRRGEPGRVEERVRLVDPVVDDPDLDPLAGRRQRRRGPPQGHGPEQRRHGVGEGVVRLARVDVGHAGHRREPRGVGHGQVDGQRVQHEAVVPGDPGRRDGPLDPGLGHRLLAGQPGEVQARAHRGRRHPLAPRREAEQRRLAPGELRERGRREPHDQLDAGAVDARWMLGQPGRRRAGNDDESCRHARAGTPQAAREASRSHRRHCSTAGARAPAFDVPSSRRYSRP